MKTTAEARRELPNVRTERKNRTHSAAYLKRELQNAVLAENLPYGKFESPTGEHFYFNYQHELLLGVDPEMRRAIPVTRDDWFTDKEWADGRVTYFYDEPIDLAEDTERLIEVVTTYREALLASGIADDYLVSWFDTLSPAYASRATRFSVVSSLILEFLPYGKCVLPEGIEIYHSKSYAVLFGWNPAAQTFVPTDRGMSLEGVEMLGHEYFYGEDVPGDGELGHPGSHPFDAGTFTLRKCMRVLDTLGAESLVRNPVEISQK